MKVPSRVSKGFIQRFRLFGFGLQGLGLRRSQNERIGFHRKCSIVVSKRRGFHKGRVKYSIQKKTVLSGPLEVYNRLTFGQQGMEEWGTITTTITTILPFPTNQRQVSLTLTPEQLTTLTESQRKRERQGEGGAWCMHTEPTQYTITRETQCTRTVKVAFHD